jgi:hypothetical protein
MYKLIKLMEVGLARKIGQSSSCDLTALINQWAKPGFTEVK